LGSAVSSPIWVWGGAPQSFDFGLSFSRQNGQMNLFETVAALKILLLMSEKNA